jgi:hypothetical protein
MYAPGEPFREREGSATECRSWTMEVRRKVCKSPCQNRKSSCEIILVPRHQPHVAPLLMPSARLRERHPRARDVKPKLARFLAQLRASNLLEGTGGGGSEAREPLLTVPIDAPAQACARLLQRLPGGLRTAVLFGAKSMSTRSSGLLTMATVLGEISQAALDAERRQAMSYSISTLLTRNLDDVFGENDPTRRRAAIDGIFTEDCVFYEPRGVYRGRDEIHRIRAARYPLDPPAIAQFLGLGNWPISKVRMSSLDRAGG